MEDVAGRARRVVDDRPSVRGDVDGVPGERRAHHPDAPEEVLYPEMHAGWCPRVATHGSTVIRERGVDDSGPLAKHTDGAVLDRAAADVRRAEHVDREGPVSKTTFEMRALYKPRTPFS